MSDFTNPTRADEYSFPEKASISSTYERAAIVPFAGSRYGSPKKIYVMGGNKGDSTGALRIVDLKNGDAVVAEKDPFSEENPSMIDMGDLGNLAVLPTVWEIQIKRVTGIATNVPAACGLLVLI